MKRFLKTLLFLYRMLGSPILAGLGCGCRFHPTCSAYALDALERLPVRRAIVLIVKRIILCGPWHSGGVDAVPLNRR